MRRNNSSFSFYAFIIALLVHVIVVLLLLFVERIAPQPVPLKEEKTSKQRFKVSLKEKPQIKNEALTKNTIQKPTIAPPMPKGEQLKTPTPSPKPKPPVEKPKEQPKQSQTAPVTQPAPKPTTSPVPQEPKKAFERHVAKEVATIERKPQPKKEFSLYDSLSTADESPRKSLQSSIKSTDSVQKLYGDKFGELSEGEQKYILDNHEAMRRITQGVLNRYGRSRIPDNLRANDINMVEFYLHPDGSMSGMRLLKNSQFAILDDTTRETIEIAYKDYPRPEQKTYIRYRVWYNLNY